MRDFLGRRDFHSLSVKDLLEARNAYHVHLAHLENVVATAIGRYRIRVADPDVADPEQTRPFGKGESRTLANTAVTQWSWPAVLVFVNRWWSPEEFARKPDSVVPRLLYLADGRVVPTCVVLVQEQEISPSPLRDLTFPSELIGGGYPVLTDVQGQTHVGSLGCLVTDGDSVYVLTSRHVAGEPGREVFSVI